MNITSDKLDEFGTTTLRANGLVTIRFTIDTLGTDITRLLFSNAWFVRLNTSSSRPYSIVAKNHE